MRPLNTIPEAAEFLRLSKWTVMAWIRAGKLRVVRLGRRVLIEQAELERFVANGKTGENDVTKPVPQNELCAGRQGEGEHEHDNA